MVGDRQYDAVVVGGGHHGSIVACYLARAGLSVGVFERRGQLGGGATSGSGPAPGFRMDRFAHWTRFYSHPAYRDFNLRAEGLHYVFPDECQGFLFDDGTSFLGHSAFKVVDPVTGRQEYAAENVTRTHEQIRQFSECDADTYLAFLDKYTRHWKSAFERYRYTPPSAFGARDPLESLLEQPDSGLEPVYQWMTVRQLAYDLFESPELRTAFMRGAAITTGCFADDVMGLQGVIQTLPFVLAFEPTAIATGGTQSITDALVCAGRKLGVEYFSESEVDEILISGDRATGVRLAGGGAVSANLVVSGLGLPQTLLRLMRSVSLHPRLARRLHNIHYDRGQLFVANIALHEPPRYVAAERNAGIGPQPRLIWGPKDPDYFASYYQPQIFLRGHGEHVYPFTSVDTLWDPSRAPAGKHMVTVNDVAPPRRLFGAERWADIKASYLRTMLARWRECAPNMTPDNIIAHHLIGPDDVEQALPDMVEGGYSQGSLLASQVGRFRPIPELSGYRTPLKNVYTCSSNLHSGPSIGRGSSYNCFKVIAGDLNLRGATG
jgi:beta-carotene ketolase (CrtO type)